RSPVEPGDQQGPAREAGAGYLRVARTVLGRRGEGRYTGVVRRFHQVRDRQYRAYRARGWHRTGVSMQMSTSRDLLEQLRQQAGLPAEAASDVHIDGGDPVLSTPIKAAETGAAATAAAGMAAAWLWWQKSG